MLVNRVNSSPRSKRTPFVPPDPNDRSWVGRALVIGLVFLAAALGVGNLWYQHFATDRAQRLMGVPGMLLVTESPQTELWQLTPATDKSPPDEVILKVNGQSLRVARRYPIATARGLINLRHALRQDASYGEAPDAQSSSSGNWSWGLRFASGEETLTLVIDLAGALAHVVETGETVELSPRMAEGLGKFTADVEAQANPKKR